MIKWKFERVSIDKLKPWEDNPRDTDEKNIKYLKESFDEFGFAGVVVTNKDYTICGGHKSLECLIESGAKEVDIKRPTKQLSNEQFKRLNYRLNQNIAGKWNEDKLAELFTADEIFELGNNEDHLAIYLQMEDIETVDPQMVKYSKEIETPNMVDPQEEYYPSDSDKENQLRISEDKNVLFSCVMSIEDRERIMDIINRTKRVINSDSTPVCLIKIMEHYEESKLQSV